MVEWARLWGFRVMGLNLEVEAFNIMGSGGTSGELLVDSMTV